MSLQGPSTSPSTDELYRRFNELLEQHSREIRLNDKVVGTISR